MGAKTTTTFTCDGCGDDLVATPEDSGCYLIVASVQRRDAEGNSVDAPPVFPENLLFCGAECIGREFAG